MRSYRASFAGTDAVGLRGFERIDSLDRLMPPDLPRDRVAAYVAACDAQLRRIAEAITDFWQRTR